MKSLLRRSKLKEHVYAAVATSPVTALLGHRQSGKTCMAVDTPSGLVGFEFKAGPTPGRTRSMVESIQDLGLTKVYVIYPGDRRYSLDDKIEVVPLKLLPTLQGLT